MLKILSLALIATGVLHNTLALLTMREALRRIRDGGIFNSVHSGDAQTFAFLWFIVAGFALMLIGLTFWQLADANRLGWPPILALLALAAGFARIMRAATGRILRFCAGNGNGASSPRVAL